MFQHGRGERQALTTEVKACFDCVVLIWGSPDMTGFEPIDQIKQDASLKTLPIIIIRAKS